jgi:glycerol-3-phosphate dehydrogenase
MKSEEYDLAIIGGGIAGAAIARDAALRGLKVVLLEKNDFGSGTSSKSSKLIHGGIRYLEIAWRAFLRQNFKEAAKNFVFVFSSLRESHTLNRISPSLVKPLAILIPLYAHQRTHRFFVYAGALLYSLMALLASGRSHFPKLYFSGNSVHKKYPELSQEALKGGIVIWDHVTDDKALVQATIRSAQKNGAVCLPHARVTHYHHDTRKNNYEIVFDQTTGEGVVTAHRLINASGPWVDQVRTLGREHDRDFILPIAGSHIEVKPFVPYSMLLQATDGRYFFVIHTGDKARIGTTERLIPNPEGVSCSEEDINYLLDSVKKYFPQANLQKRDILSCDAGVRPLAHPHTGSHAHDVSREHEFRVSGSGVIHVLGVKLTDHRRAAEEVVDRLVPTMLATHPHIKRRSLTHKIALMGCLCLSLVWLHQAHAVETSPSSDTKRSTQRKWQPTDMKTCGFDSARFKKMNPVFNWTTPADKIETVFSLLIPALFLGLLAAKGMRSAMANNALSTNTNLFTYFSRLVTALFGFWCFKKIGFYTALPHGTEYPIFTGICVLVLAATFIYDYIYKKEAALKTGHRFCGHCLAAVDRVHLECPGCGKRLT